jgi:Tfp pilus assembly protein PilN
MKRRINLYLSLPKIKTIYLSTKRILQVCAAVFIFLLGVTSYDYIQNFTLSGRLGKIRSAEQQAAKRVGVLSKKYSSTKTSAESKALKLSKEIDSKSKLLAVLSKKMSLNVRGFSKYLQSLAQQIVPGVWLSKISIENGGGTIVLTGYTFSTKAIATFIKKINSDSAFKGKKFKFFKVEKVGDEQNTLKFILHAEE